MQSWRILSTSDSNSSDVINFLASCNLLSYIFAPIYKCKEEYPNIKKYSNNSLYLYKHFCLPYNIHSKEWDETQFYIVLHLTIGLIELNLVM